MAQVSWTPRIIKAWVLSATDASIGDGGTPQPPQPPTAHSVTEAGRSASVCMDCESLRSLSAGGSDQFFRAGGVVVVGTELYTVNGLPPYTASPTSAPTVLPTTTDRPSFAPTLLPSFVPTAAPTSDPTIDTYTPTRSPTRAPTMAPNTADELGNAQLRAMRVRSAMDLHGRGRYVHKCALLASMGPCLLCCRFRGDPW